MRRGFGPGRWTVALAVPLLAVAVWARKPVHHAPSGPAVAAVAPADLKNMIHARHGKVVLVNFWATSCPPCRAEFPALMSLQRKFRSRGVSVLFVSADSTAILKTRVRPFLSQQHLTSPSWIMKGDMPSFVSGFDPHVKSDWALPHTYIYNRHGSLVKVLDVGQSSQQWESLVRPLL